MNVIITDLEKDEQLEKDKNLMEKYQISFHDMKSSMEFEKMPVSILYWKKKTCFLFDDCLSFERCYKFINKQKVCLISNKLLNSLD